MARRDFAKSKQRRKNKKSNKGTPLFKYVLLLVLILLIALISYLSFNHKSSDQIKKLDPLAEQLQKSDEKKMVVEPPKDTLPEESKERWDYLKCLELQNCNLDGDQLAQNADFDPIKTQLEKQKVLDLFHSTNADQNVPQKIDLERKPDYSKTAHQNIEKNNIEKSNVEENNTEKSIPEKKQVENKKNNSGKTSTYQCGAFRQLVNAEATSAKISLFGIKNQIIQSNDLYIVTFRIDQNQVDETLEKLKNQKINCSKRS